jgi:hypothetical protein
MQKQRPKVFQEFTNSRKKKKKKKEKKNTTNPSFSQQTNTEILTNQK